MKEYVDGDTVIDCTDKDGIDAHEIADIDTDLLCPDIIMEVKNDPITTENGENEDEAFSPNSSLYDYNITSAQAQFKLTAVEEQLKKSIYRLDPDCIKYSKIHCTACNAHLGSALNNLGNVFVHPLLWVLICKECFEFYSNGTFEKDEDGSEKYCRWCGQGGGVLCCSVCPMVFCKMCIRINFSLYKYTEIRDNDDWKCFSCEPHQIMVYKVQCHEFARYVQTKMCIADSSTADYYTTNDFSQCCSTLRQGKKRKSSADSDPDYDPQMADSGEENDGVESENEASRSVKIELETGELKKNAAETKRLVTFGSTNNCNESKPVIKVYGSVRKYSAHQATDISTQKNILAPTQHPSVSISANSSQQNSSNPDVIPILPKPIWTFTKLPQKSIIISKAGGGQTSFGPVTSTPVAQPHFVLRKANNIAADYEKSNRMVEKAILDTALANGSYGSALLGLEQKFTDRRSLQKVEGGDLALYKEFQEAVSTMLMQLLEVKKRHLLANVRPGTNSRLVPVTFGQEPIPVSDFYNKQTKNSSSASFSLRIPELSLLNRSKMDSKQKTN